MATAVLSHAKCPVCHEDFIEPKLLPCAHLVCRRCLVSWLEKGGDQNGCPLCRAPILPAGLEDQGDLASQVDALPTDLATAVVMESEKTLAGSHVCSCCEDAEATLFCLQCAVKLCNACGQIHGKLPLTRDHITEKLSKLSAEQLASQYPVFCADHSSKQAELYCMSHEQLMCVLCVASEHQTCSDLKGIAEGARVKREELKVLVKKLEEKEATITAKISQLDTEVSDAHAKFKAMRDEVKATFDDLQTSLEAQRQKLNQDIQQREETFLAERKSSTLDLENHRAALSAHKSKAEHLISSAPDGSLLGMMGKLKTRLDAQESQVLHDPKTPPGSLVLDSDTVKKTKDAVAANGKLTDSPTQNEADDRCLWCGRLQPLEGPDYAAVIRVGDRVRYRVDNPPGVGTVTAVPSSFGLGWVTVKWDSGDNYRHRMGAEGCYDLKRVFKE